MDTNTIWYTSWCILMFSLLQYVHEITTLSYGFIYPFQLKPTQVFHMHLTSQCFWFTSICPINFDAVTDSLTTKFRYSMNLIRQLNSDSFHNFLKLKLMMTRMPTPRNWWWLAFSLSLQRKNSEWTLNKFQTLLFLLPHITDYSFVTFMISARCTGGLPQATLECPGCHLFLEMQFNKRQEQ